MSDRPRVLITGGAKRVGRAIAGAFADADCDLVLTYRTSRAEAEAARDSLRTDVTLVPLDLDDLEAVQACAESLTIGRLDAVVHNASIYEPSPLAEVSAASAHKAYRINALAPLLLSRTLAPTLRASPIGSIVAMADMHVLGRPRIGFIEYAMSKAALVEMVRSLARELAPDVRVNAIAPGVVAFPDAGPESEQAMQQAYLSRVPLGRSGTPEDAARMARWLALEATYVTGEIIRLDGGRWLA